MENKNRGFQTSCIHSGEEWNKSGHLSPPICQSTAFEFPNTEQQIYMRMSFTEDGVVEMKGSLKRL